MNTHPVRAVSLQLGGLPPATWLGSVPACRRRGRGLAANFQTDATKLSASHPPIDVQDDSDGLEDDRIDTIAATLIATRGGGNRDCGNPGGRGPRGRIRSGRRCVRRIFGLAWHYGVHR